MQRFTTGQGTRPPERAAPPCAGIVADAARFLLNSGPVAWRSLLRTHVPDDSGHCTGCTATAAAPVWPCTLWYVGDAADQLARHDDLFSRPGD